MTDIEKRRADRWNFLFIAGMWFQDLFNYDFRRTEMCIIPYGTQQGEISFCAYNTGIGWRNILEKMHMTATLTKWYEDHGRHEIFAGNKNVPLASKDHSLILNAEAVAAGAQTDLDDIGVAKNAREEKLAARKKSNMTPEEIKAAHGDGAALPPAGAQGAADDPDPGPRSPEEAGRPGSHAQGRRLDLRRGGRLQAARPGPATHLAGPFHVRSCGLQYVAAGL